MGQPEVSVGYQSPMSATGSRRARRSFKFARAAVACVCVAGVVYLSDGSLGDGTHVDHAADVGRRLNGWTGDAHRRLSGLTIQAPSAAECMTVENTAGSLIGQICLTLFMFLGLAIVCDDFFMPALEKISEVLDLTPDVAGATFLAAGSSAPELFTSLGDTFGPGTSIGLGTIIGSAMFNILVIVALAAAVAGGENLIIDWRPVARDVTCYVGSVFMMWGFFADSEIHAWEAAIMVASYLCYIVLMKFNPKLMDWMDRKCTCMKKVVPVVPDEAEAAAVAAAASSVIKTEIANVDGTPLEESADGAVSKADPAGEGAGEADGDDDGSRFDMPDGLQDRVLWFFSLPFLVLFTFTIPDCGAPKYAKYYVMSFAMSIIWIGVLCFVMVDSASLWGCMLRVPPVAMGIIVLSVGTSVPDAIGSMVAARQGEADMAIANAVGSNIFDILLGLGFPWLLKSLITGEVVGVDNKGAAESVTILLITVGLFIGVLIAQGWKMTKIVGVALFFLYLVYVIYNIIIIA